MEKNFIEVITKDGDVLYINTDCVQCVGETANTFDNNREIFISLADDEIRDVDKINGLPVINAKEALIIMKSQKLKLN